MNTLEALDGFLKSRRAKGLSKETVRWYTDILRKFAQRNDELPLRSEPIFDFLESLRAGDERRHGYYRALRAFYNNLVRRRLIRHNPMLDVDAPVRTRKRPRPLTIDELDQLLSYPHLPWIKAALLFMADSGARVGEAAKLRVQDLSDTQWGPVALVNGKTGARFVPLSQVTYSTLLRVLPFRITPNRLCRKVSAAFRDAHVRGTAHVLRHTFGSCWNGDELILQYIMGHSHLSTTLIYRQLRTQKMSEQHREYSPLRMILANRQIAFPIDQNSGLHYNSR